MVPPTKMKKRPKMLKNVLERFWGVQIKVFGTKWRVFGTEHPYFWNEKGSSVPKIGIFRSKDVVFRYKKRMNPRKNPSNSFFSDPKVYMSNRPSNDLICSSSLIPMSRRLLRSVLTAFHPGVPYRPPCCLYCLQK